MLDVQTILARRGAETTVTDVLLIREALEALHGLAPYLSYRLMNSRELVDWIIANKGAINDAHRIRTTRRS